MFYPITEHKLQAAERAEKCPFCPRWPWPSMQLYSAIS